MESARLSATLVATLVALLAGGAAGFDAHKMKKCADNHFCKRHRGYAASPDASPEARAGAYIVDGSTLTTDAEGARAIVASAKHKVPLELRISAVGDGSIARLRIKELHPLHPRFEPPHVLIELEPSPISIVSQDHAGAVLSLGGGKGSVRLEYSPLRVRFLADDGAELATFNGRGLFEFEHYRERAPQQPPAAESDAAAADGEPSGAEGEEGSEKAATTVPPEDELMWEESFQSHRDTRPRGPSSIGLDISLNGFSHVYGLPERAAPFDLKDTR
jgi:alpha 1,3-glucosidase